MLPFIRYTKFQSESELWACTSTCTMRARRVKPCRIKALIARLIHGESKLDSIIASKVGNWDGMEMFGLAFDSQKTNSQKSVFLVVCYVHILYVRIIWWGKKVGTVAMLLTVGGGVYSDSTYKYGPWYAYSG